MAEVDRMLQRVLEQAKAVSEQAEVFHLSGWSRPVVFEANRLKSLVGRDSSGMALRLIKDGRVGFSSTTHWDGADTLVENALETAPFGPEAAMEFPGPGDFTPVPLYDPAVESQSLEDMIQLGQRLIDGVRAIEPELLCDASVSRSVSTLRLLNSNGAAAEYTRSGFSAYVGGALIKGTDMLFLGDGDRSCSPISDPASSGELRPHPAGARARRRLPRLRRSPRGVHPPRGGRRSSIPPAGWLQRQVYPAGIFAPRWQAGAAAVGRKN